MKAELGKPITESYQVMMMFSNGKTSVGYGSKSIYQSLLAIGIKWATFTNSEALLAMTREEGGKEMKNPPLRPHRHAEPSMKVFGRRKPARGR